MQKTQRPYIPYLILMQWLMLAGLIAFGLFMAWDTGLLPAMLSQDNTRLSLLILALFFIACLHCFERSLFLSRQSSVLYHHTKSTGCPDSLQSRSPVYLYLSQIPSKVEQESSILTEALAEEIRGQHQIGWFVTGVLIKLGLLGTVIGFMLMLGSLDSVKSMDIEQVQTLMQTMTQGMKIALNTTLLGLGASLLLGTQYLYLDRRADQLVAQAILLAQAGIESQNLSVTNTALQVES